MLEEMMNLQMTFLIKHLGEHVTCIYWEISELKEVSGILKEVTPFDRIIIDNIGISFVGVNIAIEKVIANGKPIYSCPLANGYKGCYAKDHFALVGAQKSILGRSVKYEELVENYKKCTPEQLPHIIEGGRNVK